MVCILLGRGTNDEEAAGSYGPVRGRPKPWHVATVRDINLQTLTTSPEREVDDTDVGTVTAALPMGEQKIGNVFIFSSAVAFLLPGGRPFLASVSSTMSGGYEAVSID